MKRTKIVATIGPSSQDERVLTQMILAGLNVVRLNFSHGNLEEKQRSFDLVKKISSKLNLNIPIIADLSGPKIRLGDIDGTFKIKKGDILTFGKNKNTHLPIQFDFSSSVQKGQRLLLSDARISLIIESSKDGIITAKALNNGWVTSRKGINLPDTKFNEGIFTKEDKVSAEFAINNNADFIAISFVDKAEDIKPLRELINKKGSKAKIITKVERPNALEDIERIINASDCIMVARGDLASETTPAQVPLAQQKMTVMCRQKQKPVIIATEMLDSMINNPRPTRAEASDVANAVVAQVDAVMLSAETASGDYPLETIKTMNSIIETVESDPEFRRYIKINWEKINLNEIKFNALASSSASLAYRLKSPVIGIGTVTGKTVSLLSSFRPSALICAMTHDDTVARQMSLLWGVNSTVVPADIGSEIFGDTMFASIKKQKLAKKGESVVLVWGSKVGISGTTNTIRVVKY